MGRETTRSDGGGESPRADLLLVAGEGRLSVVEVEGKAELLIGRAPDCDVALDHRALSRRHAVLKIGPPATVQDLGSHNGTRIARELVRGGDPVTLAAGESFHIGPFSLVLVTRARGSSSVRPAADRLVVPDPTPEGLSSLIREIGRAGGNVLIIGETGAGKEVLAESLHQVSERPGALVRINCAALSATLLESELFGHERGAFTGAQQARPGLLEAAEGGTLLLDEIGEMPLDLQPKLLRAIEAREVLRIGATRPTPIDVRFIAATNRDLPERIAAGQFRHDLFFRLDGVTLTVPPLRSRKRQIGVLAVHLLADAARRAGKTTPSIAPDTVRALERHPWPGNVRELKAVMERALLFARGGLVEPHHLAFAPAPPERLHESHDAADSDERERIVRMLEANAGNQTRTAAALGMSRTTFVTKLRLLKIPRPRAR